MHRGHFFQGIGWLRTSSLPAVLLVLSVIAPPAVAQDVAKASLSPSSKPSPKPEAALAAEYQRRFAALPSDDVKGHYALAQWCNEQGQYELAVKQTQYVLKLDPKHVDARLLNTVALRKVDEVRREQGLHGRPMTAAEAGLVTKPEVQKLRFLEMLDFQAERISPTWRESVSVRFEKGTLTHFLDVMGDAPEFTGKANRQRFFSLNTTQQTQVIRQFSGSTYQPKIEILSDPLVFRRFRPVAAVVERGCSTRDCHGGENPARPFGWRGHFLYPEQSLYTQFLILDRVSMGRNRLIDRDQPADSLILQYGLPARPGRQTHPGQIKPLYPMGTDDPGYRMVHDWIEMLRTPRPMNGIKLEGYPEPPPPGSQLTVLKEGAASQPSK